MDFYADRGQSDWLANVTEDMIRAGQEVTNRWLPIWSSGLRQVYNDQKTGADVEKGDTDIQINEMWPAMMQETAIQAQRRPMIVVEPHDEQQMDEEAAKFWEGHLQHRFIRDLDMPEVNKAASLDAFCFGLYVAKAYWEPKAEWDMDRRQWIGRPMVNLMWPPFFGADPEAERIDTATSYVYSGRRVSVDWMLQRWGRDDKIRQMILNAAEQDPYNADYARGMQGSGQGPVMLPHGTSEAEMATAFQKDGQQDIRGLPVRGRLADLIEGARGLANHQDIRNATGRPRHLTLWEIYFRDLTEQQKDDVKSYTFEELEEMGAAYVDAADKQVHVGNPEIFKNKKLKEGDLLYSYDYPDRSDRAMEPSFPRGRYVLKIGKDDIMNPKEADQVYPYKRWPYVTGVYHKIPHTWYGLNGTEMAEGQQFWINSCYTSLLNYVNYHGNPVVKLEENSLKEGETFTKKPGAVVNMRANKMDGLQNLESPQLSPAVMNVVMMLQNNIKGQTGKHDQALGKTGKVQETATAVAAKEQSDMVRSSLQIQHRDRWIRQIMDLVAELDQRNLTEGDWVRLTGQGFTSRAAQITDQLLNLDFAIKLKIGTDLPFDRERKKADLERLAGQIGIMPIARELLEAFDIDNVDKILDRIEGFRQYEAFMAQMQEQQNQVDVA